MRTLDQLSRKEGMSMQSVDISGIDGATEMC